jgi:hypothetical protein
MKLLLSAALLLVPPVAANATDTPWRPLFNGRDLTGWKIVGAQPAGEADPAQKVLPRP